MSATAQPWSRVFRRLRGYNFWALVSWGPESYVCAIYEDVGHMEDNDTEWRGEGLTPVEAVREALEAADRAEGEAAVPEARSLTPEAPGQELAEC